MKTQILRICGIVFLLCALSFLLPLCYGLYHISMMYPALIFLILSAICFVPKRFAPLLHGRLKKWGITFIVIFCVAVLFSGTLLGIMIHTAYSPLPEEEDATVIVLGCRINDDKPSRILQNRIDAAFAYLQEHPDAICIATGGQADDEIMPEAQCIAQTLISMGIDEHRIYQETVSTNTYENLQGSAAIIDEKHLSGTVIIASDDYHQYRASLFAEKNGLTAYALPCKAFVPLAPGYWARELLAVCAAYLLY